MREREVSGDFWRVPEHGFLGSCYQVHFLSPGSLGYMLRSIKAVFCTLGVCSVQLTICCKLLLLIKLFKGNPGASTGALGFAEGLPKYSFFMAQHCRYGEKLSWQGSHLHGVHSKVKEIEENS